MFLAVFVLSTIGSATPWGVRSRARSEARSLRKSGGRLLRRNRGRLSETAAQEVEAALVDVDRALKQSDKGLPALEAKWRLSDALDEHLAFARKGAVASTPSQSAAPSWWRCSCALSSSSRSTSLPGR